MIDNKGIKIMVKLVRKLVFEVDVVFKFKMIEVDIMKSKNFRIKLYFKVIKWIEWNCLKKIVV